MRTLIAVISYSGDAENGSHQAIRNTWGKDCSAAGADLRFFIGRRTEDFLAAADEILVKQQDQPTCGHDPSIAVEGCCQDYMQYETREILRWSIEHGYDFTFLPSTDTFLIPRKLMASGFEKYDYSGQFVPRNIPLGTKTVEDIYGHKVYLWADAGVGWFMSQKAARIIVSDKPDFWTNDIHVGQALGPLIAAGEILAGNLSNFWNETSWHYRFVMNRAYNPTGARPDIEWMNNMYEKYGRMKG